MSRRDFRAAGVFGSELLPASSVIKHVTTASISFTTDPQAVRDLLPHHFEPGPQTVVRISHLQYEGVDYLAGRGYNVISVSVPVVLSRDRDIRGDYSLVLWESSPHAVVLGRELQGYPKVYADVPDATAAMNGRTFECSEFGTVLLEGTIQDLQALDQQRLARLNARTSESSSLGWKYIPGIDAKPDCDYVTRARNPVAYQRGWSGEGSVVFNTPTWQEAPISARIVQRIAALPVLRPGPAFVGMGSGVVERGTVQRLEAPEPLSARRL
jgi:acetoacetate decarboxylase